MPKIIIKTLPVGNGFNIPAYLPGLGRELSQATGIPERRLVILWEFIRPGQFLFNGETASSQPETTHHPIVEIAALEGMARETLEALVKTITQKLSRDLGLAPENICAVVLPIPTGNLYVGGEFKAPA